MADPAHVTPTRANQHGLVPFMLVLFVLGLFFQIAAAAEASTTTSVYKEQIEAKTKSVRVARTVSTEAVLAMPTMPEVTESFLAVVPIRPSVNAQNVHKIHIRGSPTIAV